MRKASGTSGILKASLLAVALAVLNFRDEPNQVSRFHIERARATPDEPRIVGPLDDYLPFWVIRREYVLYHSHRDHFPRDELPELIPFRASQRRASSLLLSPRRVKPRYRERKTTRP